MDPNDLLIGSTLDIPGKIVGFFQTILDMITSVLSALQTYIPRCRTSIT